MTLGELLIIFKMFPLLADAGRGFYLIQLLHLTKAFVIMILANVIDTAMVSE